MEAKNSTEQMFESVDVIVSAGKNELLELDIKNKRVNIDIENKEFLKGLIKMGRDFTKKQNSNKEKKKPPGALKTAKTVAETLKKNGITLVLSYKGKIVATLGEAAHPTLLQLITKTNTIAINNLPKAISMLI